MVTTVSIAVIVAAVTVVSIVAVTMVAIVLVVVSVIVMVIALAAGMALARLRFADRSPGVGAMLARDVLAVRPVVVRDAADDHVGWRYRLTGIRLA